MTATARTAGNVRAEMARHRLTGTDLAHALGWSITTTRRRLNGTHPFDVEELAQVAGVLGVPVTELVGEEG